MAISQRYSTLNAAKRSTLEVFSNSSFDWRLRLTRPITNFGEGTRHIEVWYYWHEDKKDFTLTTVQYLKHKDGTWFWRQR